MFGSALLGVAALSDGTGAFRTFDWSGTTVPVLMLFGAGQALVYYLLYRGFGRGQVSLLSPVFASFTGLVALFSVVVLGESLSSAEAVLLVAVFAGVLLLSVVPGGGRLRLRNAPGVPEVVVATVLAAAWTLGWNSVVGGRNPLICAFVMYTAMTLVFALSTRGAGLSLRGTARSAGIALLFIGLGEAAAYLAITWAYSRSSATSLTAVLSGAFSLPTIVLARIWLNERLTKIASVGAALTLVSIGALAAFR